MFRCMVLTLTLCGIIAAGWHPTAEIYCERFIVTHLLPMLRKRDKVKILDVGGADINGSFRKVISSFDFGAIGIDRDRYQLVVVDIDKGPGVDVVLGTQVGGYEKLLPFPRGEFDVVVTTSCLEHDLFFWQTFVEMCRVVSEDGGLIYINAPSDGSYHAYPRDNWRFFPDAGLALAKWATLNGYPTTLVQSFVGAGNKLHDFVAVFKRSSFVDSEPIEPGVRINPELLHLDPGVNCQACIENSQGNYSLDKRVEFNRWSACFCERSQGSLERSTTETTTREDVIVKTYEDTVLKNLDEDDKTLAVLRKYYEFDQPIRFLCVGLDRKTVTKYYYRALESTEDLDVIVLGRDHAQLLEGFLGKAKVIVGVAPHENWTYLRPEFRANMDASLNRYWIRG